MSKNYLKYLISNCKDLKKKYKEIIDFIVYGSYVKGKSKAEDIDLMILFLDKSLKKRLDIIQELKNTVKKEYPDIDIKSMNITELFNKDLLARQGILIEGISLVSGRSFAETLGFRSCSLFNFNLKNLKHKDKIRFNYALYGRKEKGFLHDINGEYLGRGVVKVPIKESDNFEEFLERWNINYKTKKILEPTY